MAYWVGGILLGVINILLLVFGDATLKMSEGFAYVVAIIGTFFGIDMNKTAYFKYPSNQLPLGSTWVNNFYTYMIIGIILGGLIGALMASEWRIRKVKRKSVGYALVGGALMGYGARIAMGCNMGGYFSGIPSFSLQGWILAVSFSIGSYIGVKILMRSI